MTINIDKSVVRDFGLKPHEGWLFMVLLSFVADGERECFPSITTLQKASGLSRPAVTRGIKKLEEKELIVVERDTVQKGKNCNVNHYTIKHEGTSVCGVLPSQQQTPPLVNDVNHLVNDVYPNSLYISSSDIEVIESSSKPQLLGSNPGLLVPVVNETDLFTAFSRATNTIVSRNQKNLEAARVLVQLGFTAQEIEDCTRDKIKGRDKNKPYYFHYLQEDAINWRTHQAKKHMTAEDQLRYHGIEPAPEDSWKWEFDAKPGTWGRNAKNGSGDVAS